VHPGPTLFDAPSLQDWLPSNHLARFIAEIAEELDLGAILVRYQRKDGRGAEAYHPMMMVRLLLYAYCVGTVSSRGIEKATYEDIAFRYLAANQHPDHDTIAAFRRGHLLALGELFAQGLRLCREAGLVKAGSVMLDGTKIAANASRRKSMDYEKLQRREKELLETIAELLNRAETTDAAEDSKYGKGRRGDELPEELADRQKRLERIREAKARLEQENKGKAKNAEQERQQQKATSKPASASQRKRWSRARAAATEEQGSINLTDADSRIMKNGNAGGYVQGYNAQAVVLANQIIVAAEVTTEAADKQQLVPMAAKTAESLGTAPVVFLADSGYFSEQAVSDPSLQGMELYVPPDRGKPGEPLKATAPKSPAAQQMREKLKTVEGKALYGLRKQTVEPVFGQIKESRGFRRFLFRGLQQVREEWRLIALTHNLLKLFRNRCAPATLPALQGAAA